MQVVIKQTDGLVTQTGPLMHKMAHLYKGDMVPYAHYSLMEIFDSIKSIPYRPDPPGKEVLMRPLYTMKMRGYGGDCDDKCIALASWAILNGVPYRFVAAAKPGRKSFHHVFCELYVREMWLHADPTYSFNTLGREREPFAQYAII